MKNSVRFLLFLVTLLFLLTTFTIRSRTIFHCGGTTALIFSIKPIQLTRAHVCSKTLKANSTYFTLHSFLESKGECFGWGALEIGLFCCIALCLKVLLGIFMDTYPF